MPYCIAACIAGMAAKSWVSFSCEASPMSWPGRWFLLSMLLVTVPGCGGVQSVPGGTRGSLRSGTLALSDVQATVHETVGTAFRRVGFGVAGADGAFQLYRDGAKGPLALSAGDY